MNYEFSEILETIKMSEIEHFDIRTVTLGINLKDCVDSSLKVTKQKIYEKILKYGKNHVRYAQEVEAQYGIKIANKRVSLTPISLVGDRFSADEFVESLPKGAIEDNRCFFSSNVSTRFPSIIESVSTNCAVC